MPEDPADLPPLAIAMRRRYMFADGTEEVMIEPTDVERMIKDGISDARVIVTDLTGTRDHYSVVVVSSEFEGKLPLKQHRMVNATLAEPLASGELHALQLKTLTPDQYDKQS